MTPFADYRRPKSSLTQAVCIGNLFRAEAAERVCAYEGSKTGVLRQWPRDYFHID